VTTQVDFSSDIGISFPVLGIEPGDSYSCFAGVILISDHGANPVQAVLVGGGR